MSQQKNAKIEKMKNYFFSFIFLSRQFVSLCLWPKDAELQLWLSSSSNYCFRLDFLKMQKNEHWLETQPNFQIEKINVYIFFKNFD